MRNGRVEMHEWIPFAMSVIWRISWYDWNGTNGLLLHVLVAFFNEYKQREIFKY